METVIVVQRQPPGKSAIVIKTINELQHEKTNKMSVRPAKTQISLGISA